MTTALIVISLPYFWVWNSFRFIEKYTVHEQGSEDAEDGGNSGHISKYFLTTYLEIFSQIAETCLTGLQQLINQSNASYSMD